MDEFSQDNVDDERFVSKADSVPAIKWEDLRYPSTNKDEEDEGDHVVLYDSCDACSNGDGDDDDDDDYSWNLAPAHLDATEDDGGSYTSYPHGGIDEELLLQRPNPNHADPTEFVDIDEVLRLHDERDVIHRPTSPFESPESSQEDSLKVLVTTTCMQSLASSSVRRRIVVKLIIYESLDFPKTPMTLFGSAATQTILPRTTQAYAIPRIRLPLLAAITPWRSTSWGDWIRRAQLLMKLSLPILSNL